MKITLFIGKSSSGKSYLCEERIKRATNRKPIALCTDRPPRKGKDDDYVFVSKDKFTQMQKQGDFLEVREYGTFFGTWRYATLNLDESDDGVEYVGVATIESAQKIIEKYCDKADINILYVYAPDIVREARAKTRQSDFSKEEWARRLKADEADYSDSNLNQLNGLLKRKVHNHKATFAIIFNY